MIEDYDELNRDETLNAVADFDARRLTEFLEFEREHKNRKTVIEPLEDELVEVSPVGEQQYVAGLWFDDPYETKVVRRNSRIDEAIREDFDGLIEVS